MNNRLFGAKGEEIAVSFLLERGYRILNRNWAVKYGELDIIALSPDNCIVFVEVKRVSSVEYGRAAEKVTPAKLKQIQKLASHYLSERGLERQSARIDVVAITEEVIDLFQNCMQLR